MEGNKEFVVVEEGIVEVKEFVRFEDKAVQVEEFLET